MAIPNCTLSNPRITNEYFITVGAVNYIFVPDS
jgi:hypothetical protein